MHGSPSNDAQDDVVLLYDAKEGFECTGTLVAPGLVLTARHCVTRVTSGDSLECDRDGNAVSGGQLGDDYPASELEVYVGATRSLTYPAFAARGTKIVDDGSSNLCNHDLAVLEVVPAITSVAPAMLRLEPEPSVGEDVTVIGWGVTEEQKLTRDRAQRSGVPLLAVGPSTLQGLAVPPNDFVLGESICDGDSGGPALVDGTGAVIGVASFGWNGKKASRKDPLAGCVDAGSGVLNTFTAVAPFRSVLQRAFADVGSEPRLDDRARIAPIDAGTDGARVPNRAPIGVGTRGGACDAAPGASDGTIAALALVLGVGVARWLRGRSSHRRAAA